MKSCIDLSSNFNQMRLCFDLDNTLVTFPKITGDYNSVEAIKKNIEYLRYLKSFGHTIIIYTARRMKTHNGNTGKLMADIGKITFDTLERFNIPYDEIFFGKPQADVYIDDLGLNCFDNLEKELGFYIDSVKPREFNTLNSKFMEIIKKESSNLAGEIFYYLNIPSKVKDMFPVITNFDDNNTWYEIEKINGLTLSVLYVSGLLNMITLKSVMDSIRRLQSCKCDVNSDINIYENYSKKLEKRYQSYDYSSFENHEYIFNDINNNLKEYEKLKKGTLRVIHGDAVLTNIIVNEYQKIKFIDMRGKLGNKLSIYGDWLYDWAKLYQSLIGYDYILLNKNINVEFQKKIVDYFTDYFITLYSENDFINLKMITKSMLFSLIPLHDNENCLKFYNLIKCKFLN